MAFPSALLERKLIPFAIWTSGLWNRTLALCVCSPFPIFLKIFSWLHDHTLFIFLIKVSGWNQESQKMQGFKTGTKSTAPRSCLLKKTHHLYHFVLINVVTSCQSLHSAEQARSKSFKEVQVTLIYPNEHWKHWNILSKWLVMNDATLMHSQKHTHNSLCVCWGVQEEMNEGNIRNIGFESCFCFYKLYDRVNNCLFWTSVSFP